MAPTPLPDEALTRPLSLTRTLLSYGLTAIAFLLTGLALLPLLSILFEVLRQGLPHLRWKVLTSLPAPVGMEGVVNGFAHALFGSFVMVGLASVVSIPLGLVTAIYVAEVGQQRAIARVIRFGIRLLSGVPSIVVGVFAYAVMVLTPIWGYKGFSALAGGFALAVVMLPIVALSTEEALTLVPAAQRLASAALGANALQTTLRIVIPSAFPGIIAGILLAVARAAGATAPLIFTALFSQNWPEGVLNPTPSLSVLIYNYANSAYVEQNQLAWSASLILVSLVLLLHVVSRCVMRHRLRLR